MAAVQEGGHGMLDNLLSVHSDLEKQRNVLRAIVEPAASEIDQLAAAEFNATHRELQRAQEQLPEINDSIARVEAHIDALRCSLHPPITKSALKR
jgi:hypothetical protein